MWRFLHFSWEVASNDEEIKRNVGAWLQAETLYLTQMVDFAQTYHELVDRDAGQENRTNIHSRVLTRAAFFVQ